MSYRYAMVLLLLPALVGLAADSALRLHYDFGEITAGVVADASGNGHAGRLEGKDGALPVVESTRYGKALRLEPGQGQGLRTPHAPDLVGAEALTVMAWVWPERVDSHLAVLANKGDRVAGHPAKGYRLSLFWHRAMAELGFGDDEDGVRLSTPEWSIEPQHWAHVAMVFDGQNLVLYLNATEAARLRLPEPRRLAPGPSAGGFTLGKYYWNDAYPFVGLLADVRIYGRALPPAEIFAAASEFTQIR